MGVPSWLRGYRREWLAGDLTAALVVTVMLIPQSLAYALLAGLPPQMGLYAGMLPLLGYALFGSSMTLAVGPVAIASLMTASALQPLAAVGSAEYAMLAIWLSLLSGLMLLAFGALRLGFLASFLSHPVISGFINGSAILIVVGQLKYLFGIQTGGHDLWASLAGLARHWPSTNLATATLGGAALLFLWLARQYLARALVRAGLGVANAEVLAKLAPMAAVIGSTAVVAALRLDQSAGVSVVGAVPQGLPRLSLTLPSLEAISQLWLPALLVGLVGFVESVSVAQSLALKRQQSVQPDRELLGLGAANVVGRTLPSSAVCPAPSTSAT